MATSEEMIGIPPQSELGQIRIANGRVYQITREDVLWLARAAKHEGGNRAATMWSWAWRFATKGQWSSFTDLIRAHSQTVNPRWDEAGDALCREHPDHCTPELLARRARARTMRFSELGGAAEQALAFVQARLANPAPRANNFANAEMGARFVERTPGSTVILRDGNWYIAERDALSKAPDHVKITQGGRTAGPGSALSGWVWVAAGTLALGAYAWYRWW